MAIRRAVFKQLGGFDERLGAGRAGCSEDSELFYNAMFHGWHCRYEPRAVTFHFHRSHIDQMKTQLFFYMRGHVAALLIQYSKYKDIGNLLRLFINLPIVNLKNFIRGLAGDPAFRFPYLWAEISGCFSGLRFYMRNRGKI
jgi:GT2 family glycosyltransferase